MVSDACRWWSTRLEKKEVRNLSALTTGEILEKVSDSGIAKAEGKTLRLLIWALLAGAYIAFGAQASQMVSFNLLADPASLGVGRLVSAAVFPVAPRKHGKASALLHMVHETLHLSYLTYS